MLSPGGPSPIAQRRVPEGMATVKELPRGDAVVGGGTRPGSSTGTSDTGVPRGTGSSSEPTPPRPQLADETREAPSEDRYRTYEDVSRRYYVLLQELNRLERRR